MKRQASKANASRKIVAAPAIRIIGSWPTSVCAAALAALVVLMFGDVLFQNSIVLSRGDTDIAQQFLAWRDFGFSELKRGHLPLWNPYLFSGMPFVGGFQSAMLYPLNVVHLLMPAGAAINWAIAWHIYLLGLFTFLWARRLGLHSLPCVLAGCLSMFGGATFLHVFAGHLPNILSMAWAPLVFLCIETLFDRPKPAWLLVGTGAVAMQILAGHPQYVFYTGIAAAIYAACLVPGSRHRVYGVAGVVAMYIGASALSAAQLTAGIAAAAESLRSQPVAYRFAAALSFPPENLATLMVPGFFGDMVSAPYWGRWYLWETSVFISTTAVVLAAYGAVAGKRTVRNSALVASAVLFVLALGGNTPLFKVLYAVVPGFDAFRGTTKFMFLAMLFVAMLSGAGLDAIVRNVKASKGLTLGVVGLAVAMGFGGMLMLSSPDGVPGWSSLVTAIKNTSESLTPNVYNGAGFLQRSAHDAGAALIAATLTLGLLAGALFSLRWTRLSVYAIVALSLFEVFAYARLSRPTFEAAAIHKPEIDRLAAFPGIDDVRVLTLTDPNTLLASRLHGLWGYDPGVSLRYAQFMAFTQGTDPDAVTQDLTFSRPHRLYDMLRLKYIVGQTPEGNTRTVERPSPMPRATLIYDYRVISRRDDIFAALGSEQFDPRSTVVLESTPAVSPSRPEHDESRALRVVDESPGRYVVDADVTSPAILLLTDGYSRDWRARANDGSGRSYQVLPANYVVMAIPIAAGHHSIRMEYIPRGWSVGVFISVLSLIVFLGATVWCWRMEFRESD